MNNVNNVNNIYFNNTYYTVNSYVYHKLRPVLHKMQHFNIIHMQVTSVHKSLLD